LHWEALCRYQEQQNKRGEKGIEYYKILNKGIQFTNYVGVIQAGNLTIEVLPKTDQQRSIGENVLADSLGREEATEKQSWHDVLLQMLKECSFLQVNHVDYANLNLKSNSILEIYLELFLSHTEKLMHEGLVKRYKSTESNLTVMKGQLMFSKNISKNVVHKERFYVRHTEYNRSNIFNQLLYKTLCLIPSLSSSPLLLDKVNRLLLDFPELPDCNVNPATFDGLVFDRKTVRYKEAIVICKMLLLNFRPDITGGRENVMAILFDMNELWEEFVYRRLIKSAQAGTSVSRQKKKPFWYNQSNEFYKWVRPDIVITKDKTRIILDTKWKIIKDSRPGDDDLKQMFVYNLLWDAKNSVLLFPGSSEVCDGSYLHFELSKLASKKEDKGFYSHCQLYFVNVLDEKGRLVNNQPFIDLLRRIKL